MTERDSRPSNRTRSLSFYQAALQPNRALHRRRGGRRALRRLWCGRGLRAECVALRVERADAVRRHDCAGMAVHGQEIDAAEARHHDEVAAERLRGALERLDDVRAALLLVTRTDAARVVRRR